jgi:hypothetical protein
LGRSTFRALRLGTASSTGVDPALPADWPRKLPKYCGCGRNGGAARQRQRSATSQYRRLQRCQRKRSRLLHVCARQAWHSACGLGSRHPTEADRPSSPANAAPHLHQRQRGSSISAWAGSSVGIPLALATPYQQRRQRWSCFALPDGHGLLSSPSARPRPPPQARSRAARQGQCRPSLPRCR